MNSCILGWKKISGVLDGWLWFNKSLGLTWKMAFK